jgi:hypothetical protein
MSGVAGAVGVQVAEFVSVVMLLTLRGGTCQELATRLRRHATLSGYPLDQG